MPPPPAEPFASRIFLGPALRAQPDRRLVRLVREGYEAAFEEIVRRYRKPLDRFAAAIVGGRSEDVTQDAFSKALLALRGTTAEIELRPWLYRIVRNTALNDLRDRAPATEELGEAIPGRRSAAVEAERREEIAELMERLRALPEPQRAAIVMREREGLSHEEIAAALGISGGAARQTIHRARTTLRDGFGMLLPLPLLRILFDHGAEAAGAGAGGAVAAAGAASAAGGGGATLGGLGAAGALKVSVATALLAGSVGAGVAMQHDRGGNPGKTPAAASAAALPVSAEDAQTSFGSSSPNSGPGPLLADSEDRGRGGRGSDDGGRDDGDRGRGEQRGSRDEGSGDDDGFDDHSSHGGRGSSPEDSSGHGGRGSGRGDDSSGHGGRSGSDDDSGGHSGEGDSGGSHSGRHSSGGGDDGGGDGSGESGSGSSGSSKSGGEDSHGGSSGDSGSSGGSGGGGSGGSDDPAPAVSAPPPVEAMPPAVEVPEDVADDDSGSGGSRSGGSSDSSDLGGSEDDS
jgi:RNA polymerase sigma factor (sigma-70 family)